MSSRTVIVPRVFVAECVYGCRLADGMPRLLEESELAPHDDKHLGHRARVLVRMLRDVSPEIRAEVLDYFNSPRIKNNNSAGHFSRELPNPIELMPGGKR